METMTDDPRSHQYSDADWEYEVDSNQREGVTGNTNPDHTTPNPTDGDEPNDEHNEDNGGFDSHGIPTGI